MQKYTIPISAAEIRLIARVANWIGSDEIALSLEDEQAFKALADRFRAIHVIQRMLAALEGRFNAQEARELAQEYLYAHEV